MIRWLKRIGRKIVEFVVPQPTIKFRALWGAWNLGASIVEARKVFPYWLKKQLADKDVKFVRCPGMHDLSTAGYLILAPYDIHIQANQHSVVVRIEDPTHVLQPSLMDMNLVDGLAPFRDNVARRIIKVPLPWGIFTKRGYSAYVVAASMHSPFLDGVYVYGGIVDYDDFSTTNFIFSVVAECDVTIWAGTPLLQVLPFKRETFTATVAKASEHEADLYKHRFFSRAPHFYRKMFHKKKFYHLTNEDKA